MSAAATQSDPAAAEALTGRLGRLSASMLAALERDEPDALEELLAERQRLQSELEPLLAGLQASAAAGLAAGSGLERVREGLLGAQAAQRTLERRVAEAVAELGAHLREQRRRSAAVLEYGAPQGAPGGGFTRVG